MKKCRNLLIAGTVGAVVLIGAPSAFSAPKNVDFRTTDLNPGGGAAFLPAGSRDGFHLRACDLQSDGRGVRAYATIRRGLIATKYVVRDVDGYNGRCVTGWIAAPAGTSVELEVCLKDHDGRDSRAGARAKDAFCSVPVTVKV